MCDRVSDVAVALELGLVWRRAVELFTYKLQPWEQRGSFAVPGPHEVPAFGEGGNSVVDRYPSEECGCAQMALFHSCSVECVRGPIGLEEIVVRILDCREVGERAHKFPPRIVALLGLAPAAHLLRPKEWDLQGRSPLAGAALGLLGRLGHARSAVNIKV